MPWSQFFQTVFLICLGAWIYHAGRSGASVFDPISSGAAVLRNVFRRPERNREPENQSPRITS